MAPIRITCIGASDVSNPTPYGTPNWPDYIAPLLGYEYVVNNEGASGTTMIKLGNSPYWNTSQYTAGLNSSPDIAIIMGNDQRELFLDDVTPAITVYTGETIWDQPADPQQAARMPPGIHEAEPGHSPPERREYPAFAELANHIARSIVPEGFDIAISKRLPEPPDHWSSGAPHSLGFIYRQIMRDRVVPHVPIIINTFFPPNQPTARRCFELGQAVGRALAAWPGDERVAVFGSGGMSHFTIDEAFDRMFMDALANRDAETLCAIEDKHLQAGTSELKTWIAAAGLLFGTGLEGGIVGYEPCYRSEAGTGTANGFVAWA